MWLLLENVTTNWNPMTKGTTKLGYVNKNNQKVVGKTDLKGNDYNQKIYELECLECGNRYGVNGSDIFQRRCPKHNGGKPGLEL